MTNATQIVDQLLDAVKDFVDRSKAPEVQPFKPLIADWGTEKVDLPHTSLPVLAYMKDLPKTTAPGTRMITELLVESFDKLNWRRSFNEEDMTDAEFLKRYGWTEVVGQGGPCVSNKVRAGFVVWAPEIYYPPHAHVAEELYVILSGTGEWTKGDEGPVMRAPGSVFLHTTQMFHSTRTFKEPVLAMYMWRGSDNLLEKPHFEAF